MPEKLPGRPIKETSVSTTGPFTDDVTNIQEAARSVLDHPDQSHLIRIKVPVADPLTDPPLITELIKDGSWAHIDVNDPDIIGCVPGSPDMLRQFKKVAFHVNIFVNLTISRIVRDRPEGVDIKPFVEAIRMVIKMHLQANGIRGIFSDDKLLALEAAESDLSEETNAHEPENIKSHDPYYGHNPNSPYGRHIAMTTGHDPDIYDPS